MTDEEALALKPGDRVYDRNSRTKRVLVVEDVRLPSWRGLGRVSVAARPEGLRRNGQRHTREWKVVSRLVLLSRFDPLTANVYADWLDEHGEPRAAALLRKAFPIDAGAR